MPEELQAYFDARIRRINHDGAVYYSLVDIMSEFSDLASEGEVLWRRTRQRLQKDGFELRQNVTELKLRAKDGKMRSTQCCTADIALRIVQSIPSERAEPVRQWLASLGIERLEENADPELGLNRAAARVVENYRKQGKSDEWIDARFRSIQSRNVFTDALKEHVLGKLNYGYATNTMYQGLYSGRDADALKNEMGIKGKLRDHQPQLAIHYQSICETIISEKLGERQTVDPRTAIEIIKAVSTVLGLQIQQISQLMGYDVGSGRPLLASNNSQSRDDR